MGSFSLLYSSLYNDKIVSKIVLLCCLFSHRSVVFDDNWDVCVSIISHHRTQLYLFFTPLNPELPKCHNCTLCIILIMNNWNCMTVYVHAWKCIMYVCMSVCVCMCMCVFECLCVCIGATEMYIQAFLWTNWCKWKVYPTLSSDELVQMKGISGLALGRIGEYKIQILIV